MDAKPERLAVMVRLDRPLKAQLDRRASENLRSVSMEASLIIREALQRSTTNGR